MSTTYDYNRFWGVTDYMGASFSVGCRHTVHVWGKALRIHKRPTSYCCDGSDLLLPTIDKLHGNQTDYHVILSSLILLVPGGYTLVYLGLMPLSCVVANGIKL